MCRGPSRSEGQGPCSRSASASRRACSHRRRADGPRRSCRWMPAVAGPVCVVPCGFSLFVRSEVRDDQELRAVGQLLAAERLLGGLREHFDAVNLRAVVAEHQFGLLAELAELDVDFGVDWLRVKA